MTKQEINKRVEEQERLGREEFKHVCDRKSNPWCKVNKFSQNKMARWDVAYYDNKTPIVADIKKRRYDSDTFSDWYFEVDKAQELARIARLSGEDCKIGYINLFENNIMWIWTFKPEELEKLDVKTVEVQKNDWSDEKVLKKVYCLYNAQAQRKEEINLIKSIFNIIK